MKNNIISRMKEEKGAVQIIEATFVFPIMFIILFFLIYMGNAFYLKSQVESIVAQKAIEGAAYCTDPLLETIKESGGSLPEINDLDIKPYRYLFGGMDDIEQQIGEEVENEISNSTVTFFRNMNPVVKTKTSDIAKYDTRLMYATFSVDVECRVQFPIRFIGQDAPYILKLNSHAEVAVNDATEFIRNTDMVIDYFVDSKLGQTIKGIFDKINDFIGNFANL